jgi:hypothetical protein
MITDPVRAVRVPPNHPASRVVAAVAARSDMEDRRDPDPALPARRRAAAAPPETELGGPGAARGLLAALLAGDRVVVAVATGDQFDIGLLRSADLLLVSGTVKADIDEPTVPHGKSPSADWENSDEEEVPSE